MPVFEVDGELGGPGLQGAHGGGQHKRVAVTEEDNTERGVVAKGDDHGHRREAHMRTQDITTTGVQAWPKARCRTRAGISSSTWHASGSEEPEGNRQQQQLGHRALQGEEATERRFRAGTGGRNGADPGLLPWRRAPSVHAAIGWRVTGLGP